MPMLQMRPRALHVLVNATAFWFLYNGAPPARILQAIAAGLLGKESFAGGAATAGFGLLLHFLIACGMAAVYWLACRRWPVLLQKPLAAGDAPAIHPAVVHRQRARARRPGRPAIRVHRPLVCKPALKCMLGRSHPGKSTETSQ